MTRIMNHEVVLVSFMWSQIICPPTALYHAWLTHAKQPIDQEASIGSNILIQTSLTLCLKVWFICRGVKGETEQSAYYLKKKKKNIVP